MPPVANKFVKPKTRIPQQLQPAKVVVVQEKVVNLKAKPSLKAFLNNPVPSRRVHTSIWKTSSARVNDSNSYSMAIKKKNYVIEKKRMLKDYIKQMSEEYERQRLQMRRDLNEDHDMFRSYYQAPDLTSSQSYSKQRTMYLDRWNTSKASSETTPNSKNFKEDPSRAFEEAEMKSTAVSCQERINHRDLRLKSPQHIPYDDYQLEHDNSNYEVHQIDDKEDRELNHNNKSLLDQIFEQNNLMDYELDYSE